jgi:predicted PurR-regulated permease PerM
MQKELKNMLILTIGILIMLFANSIRSVVTPFILAAVLAYFVSPLVGILERKFKISRILSIVIVFLVIITAFSLLAVNVTIRIAEEQRDLNSEYGSISTFIKSQQKVLPPWTASWLFQLNGMINLGTIFSPQRLWPYFSGALSGVGSIFVWLVATFYFMKDGKIFTRKIIGFLIGNNHEKASKIVSQIYTVLNSYLRGQVLLIFLMSSVSFVALSILKVKFAFILAIFTGIAEIVPLIGPVIATSVVALVAMFDGIGAFSLSPLFQALTVIIIYFILRQLEDQLVIPIVMGRATKLHPLLILFLVLVGGQIWGVIGMILAVPLAAVVRILFINRRYG